MNMNSVNSISNKNVGRPAGGSDAKEKILEAARTLFADSGYDRTSLRQVATRAGVDASLIMHHFGSKQQLFVAAMVPLFEGPKRLPDALSGDRHGIGRRLATLFATITSHPPTRELMLGLFKSASSEEQAAAMLRTFAQEMILRNVESYLPGPNRKLQTNILGAQIIGTFFARYVIKIEPLAGASTEELIEYLAPRLQAHFEVETPHAST